MNHLIISWEAALTEEAVGKYFTIAWNSLEGLTGIGTGIIAAKHLA